MNLFIDKFSSPPKIGTLDGDKFIELDNLTLKFGSAQSLTVTDTDGNALSNLTFAVKTKDFDSSVLIYAEGEDLAELNTSSMQLYVALGSLPELYCVGEFSYTDNGKRTTANISVIIENAVCPTEQLYPVPLQEYPVPENIALKSDIATLTGYPDAEEIALKSDLEKYPEPEEIALKSDLGNLPNYPKPEEIALKSELPDISAFPEPENIVVKEDLAQYPDPESIALKSDLEEYPEPANIALKSELPDLSAYPAPEEIAVKADLADLPDYPAANEIVTKSILAQYPDPGNIALQSELDKYPEPDNVALKSELDKYPEPEEIALKSEARSFLKLDLNAGDFPGGYYVLKGGADYKLFSCSIASEYIWPASKRSGNDLIIYMFDPDDDISVVYDGYFTTTFHPIDILLVK